MIKATERGEAREVTLNYSANAGYDVEIGYFLHHKKHNSKWYLGISQIYGWVSRQPICLKLNIGPSSQGRDGLELSPLTTNDQEVLDVFSNKLGTVLSKAFNGKPVRKLKRQTIVFYFRVSCQGQELYYRKVYQYTFDNLNEILKQVPNVRKAFIKDIFSENPS